jgi:hypothetical protein
MKRALLATTLAVLASGGLLCPVHAAGPALSLRCSPPAGGKVACHLTGRGFQPLERIYAIYKVRISPGETTVYLRQGTSHSDGSFSRPKLYINGGHNGLFSYRVTVDAIGSRGDEATITTAGTP